MTLLLFTKPGKPVGRYELSDLAGKQPDAVQWAGRTFVWAETTEMGWQRYTEVEPMILHGLRIAPAMKEP